MHGKFQQLLPTKIGIKEGDRKKKKKKNTTFTLNLVANIEHPLVFSCCMRATIIFSSWLQPDTILKHNCIFYFYQKIRKTEKFEKKKKKEFFGGMGREGRTKKENQAAHPGTKSGSFLMDSATAILWPPYYIMCNGLIGHLVVWKLM